MEPGIQTLQRFSLSSARPLYLAGFLVLYLALMFQPQTGLAWGPVAHQVVVTSAFDTLPPEIRPFFESNRQFLIQHANDSDQLMKTDRYERMRHYIYLDKYGQFPYPTLPHDYLKAKEKYMTFRISRDGMLPWQIGEYSLRLTKAMRAGNWDEVRLDAVALANYVADADDPLHTTQDYDGQLTSQTGLSLRFDFHLFDRYSKFFMMHPEPAEKIDDPTEFAFQRCLESNVWVNLILWSDLRARDGLADYNDEYYDRFYDRVRPTVVQEINEAAHDVGSYWYTSWLNAGRPQLPGR
jgi:hypothetical protein